MCVATLIGTLLASRRVGSREIRNTYRIFDRKSLTNAAGYKFKELMVILTFIIGDLQVRTEQLSPGCVILPCPSTKTSRMAPKADIICRFAKLILLRTKAYRGMKAELHGSSTWNTDFHVMAAQTGVRWVEPGFGLQVVAGSSSILLEGPCQAVRVFILISH
jgi:hypothetical protein